MRGRRLWKAAVGFHFDGMDQIREFDGVLNKENRDVVANQIPVTFLRIKLHSKAAYIARGIDGTGTAGDGRDARKHRRPRTDFGEYLGGGVVLERGGQFEKTMRTRGTRVNDTLGDAFMIEMGDFFAQDKIFQQGRSARIRAQRILVIGECDTLVSGECGVCCTRDLV